jgi:hypothetical protein
VVLARQFAVRLLDFFIASIGLYPKFGIVVSYFHSCDPLNVLRVGLMPPAAQALLSGNGWCAVSARYAQYY